MSAVAEAARWTGYLTWGAIAWAVANRLMLLLWRLEGELRRYRNARRMATFRPQARPRDPGEDLTRVMPAIQRPQGRAR